MKAEEIRGLADDQLKVRINELEEERFRLRFRAGTEQLEEPLRLRSVRRDIARIQTIVRERALGIVRESAPVAKKSAKTPAKKGTKGTATKAAAKKATKARGR